MSKKKGAASADSGHKYEAVVDWVHYAPDAREEQLRLVSVSVAEMYWQVVAPVRRREISGNRNYEVLMKDHGPFSHIRRAGTLPPPRPPKPDAVSKPVERIVRTHLSPRAPQAQPNRRSDAHAGSSPLSGPFQPSSPSHRRHRRRSQPP
jgi:hypothetical protein